MTAHYSLWQFVLSRHLHAVELKSLAGAAMVWMHTCVMNSRKISNSSGLAGCYIIIPFENGVAHLLNI
jgi:hypothetical protein